MLTEAAEEKMKQTTTTTVLIMMTMATLSDNYGVYIMYENLKYRLFLFKKKHYC